MSAASQTKDAILAAYAKSTAGNQRGLWAVVCSSELLAALNGAYEWRKPYDASRRVNDMEKS